MKKILLSIVTISAVVAVAVAATSAYFTSQSVLGASTVASGTLNVSATSNNKTYLDLGSIGKLAPGEHTDWITITVKNTGSLNAATFGKFELTDDNGLAQFLKLYDYKVEYYKANNDAVQRWDTDDNYYGTKINEDYFIKDGDYQNKWANIGASTLLTEWTSITGHGAEDVPPKSWDIEGLKAGYYYVISFRLQMSPDANNTAQNKYSKLGYRVLATQVVPEALANMATETELTADYLSTSVYPAVKLQVDTY